MRCDGNQASVKKKKLFVNLERGRVERVGGGLVWRRGDNVCRSCARAQRSAFVAGAGGAPPSDACPPGSLLLLAWQQPVVLEARADPPPCSPESVGARLPSAMRHTPSSRERAARLGSAQVRARPRKSRWRLVGECARDGVRPEEAGIGATYSHPWGCRPCLRPASVRASGTFARGGRGSAHRRAARLRGLRRGRWRGALGVASTNTC